MKIQTLVQKVVWSNVRNIQWHHEVKMVTYGLRQGQITTTHSNVINWKWQALHSLVNSVTEEGRRRQLLGIEPIPFQPVPSSCAKNLSRENQTDIEFYIFVCMHAQCIRINIYSNVEKKGIEISNHENNVSLLANYLLW